MCEISIIIPVYNKRRYLKRTVKLLLEQTFCDYELILIDDGSTDGSGPLCDTLAEADPRVRTIHTKNQGVSAARNLGIRKAAGKYIGFIDGDDTVDKTFLEKLYAAIEKDAAGLAVCGYSEISGNSRIARSLETSDMGCELYDLIRYNVLCVLWNKLFVRKKIRHPFIENLSTAEDSLFCIQYYLDNHPKIAYVYEDLYGYQKRGDGLTGALQPQALYGIGKLYQYNMKLLALLPDVQMKRLAFHHICIVYFYGIYTFIFENICSYPKNNPKKKEALAIVADILQSERYQRCIRYILKYPLQDKRAEKMTKKQLLYILFSLFGRKREILFLARLKKSYYIHKGYMKWREKTGVIKWG
ncbi:MAG: glycosyltransferase family 2 protein [Lachnospiraceae bacterium]|nr:glycosyltransferase family 2 protein [Lachnospiraceae bacterium]